jgi:hypothetical protein
MSSLKRTSPKSKENFQIQGTPIELTKNPQPILQSFGSEGDAVVSFWSFMIVFIVVVG